ncbi:MAG: hypothetical protein ACI9R3_002021 [Verrucomicrobiales bacterium]|jgi:hypothetical protein
MNLESFGIHYKIEGDSSYGDERVLLNEDDNLIADCEWADEGYSVGAFLSPSENQKIKDGIRDIIYRELGAVGVKVPDNFPLEKYHELVGVESDAESPHMRLINRTRGGYPTSEFPIDISIVSNRISELVGVPVSTDSAQEEGGDAFFFRIVRPGSSDNNPLHRDVWLDRLRNAVNIYGPIAGSNDQSSLIVIPTSHHWKESEIERTGPGAKVNGFSYTVPAVVGALKEIKPIRPNPGADEVLVFSPYCIHGGATNMSGNLTRVSLETRFWRI